MTARSWPVTAIRWSIRLASVVAVGLVILLPFAMYPVPSLFLLNAETSRLQYVVNTAISADQARIYVRGAHGRVGNEFLRNADSKAGEDTGCYEGFVEVLSGTTVEFSMLDGLQQLLLSRSDDRPVARLSQDIVRLRLGALQPETNLFQLGHSEVSPEYFVLEEQSTFTIDPACAPDGGDLGFGHKGEPLVIDGPGQIGRNIRTYADGLRHVDRYPVFVSGEIDVLVRSGLCRRYLRLSCNRLFRVSSNPIPIPPGAAVEGGTDRPRGFGNEVEQAHFKGYAFFENNAYHVSLSSDAMTMLLLLPSPEKNRPTRDRLSVSTLERLSVEPVITVLFSTLIALIGVIIGLAQIVPPGGNSPATGNVRQPPPSRGG